jgi:uncharacterized protein (DUF58 family)
VEIHPTRSTFHVAVAGAGLVALGAAARLAPVVAFGGAMLLAVALGRAMALVAVTRLRAAGFEMVWAERGRVRRVPQGATIVIRAELRNRSGETVRGVALRPIASSMLEASVEPRQIDLPARERTLIDVTVRALRVGRWGLHGIALEIRSAQLGGEGLYEVPLLFANPLGLEVLPPSLSVYLQSPRGGRARRTSNMGRPANLAGAGDELRELRDHVPGDPFKRIAWKASARRGRLLVREMEREEREVVWLVLDASVELWAGEPGHAPLDRAVEDLAALATRHLRRGDRVGLVVTASRLRTWIEPEEGAAHGAILAGALASAASAIDADRSELDEAAVGRRVLEHARPLDPRGLADVAKGNLDALAKRADQIRMRAPFAPRVPFAHTAREQKLRHYLAAFGIESPPRIEGEHDKAEIALLQVLARLVKEAQRGSIVHVWAPAPSKGDGMAKAVRTLRVRRILVRWSLPPLDAGVGSGRERRSPVADAVDEAVRLRAHATRARAEKLLRRIGVRLVIRPSVKRGAPPDAAREALDRPA